MTAAPWDAASTTVADILPAFCVALGELTDIARRQTADAGRYSYSYADLAQLLEVVRPTLAGHGLAITQTASTETGPGAVTVRTTIVHTSGEWLTFPALRLPVSGSDPQSLGSGITYARRYSLLALLGVATEDDDGAAASRTGPAATQPATRRGAEPDWGALGYSDQAEHDDRLAAASELAASLPDEAKQTLRAEFRQIIKPITAVDMGRWEQRVANEYERWIATEAADDWPVTSLDTVAGNVAAIDDELEALDIPDPDEVNEEQPDD